MNYGTTLGKMNKKDKKEKCVLPKRKKHISNKHQSIIHKHNKKIEELQDKQTRLLIIDSDIKKLTNDLDKVKKKKAFNRLNNETFEESNNNLLCRNIERDINTLLKSKEIIIKDEDYNDYILESSQIILKYMNFEEQENELLGKKNLQEKELELLNSINKQKRELSETYLIKFEENYIPTQQNLHIYNNVLCQNCNIEYDTVECYLSCSSCGACLSITNCDGELSYKEIQDYDYRPAFMYNRNSHLLDHLKRLESKDNREITQEIIDKIIIEANKERITDLTTITEAKIKKYLKRLKLNEYYDNVIGIINKLTGRPPIVLTKEIEEKILYIFQQIQDPYNKYKPQNRKNFLSYSYILHKLFQILGLHEFTVYFPLLKSTDKLRLQDEIFKKIVDEMAIKDKSINWIFIPSV